MSDENQQSQSVSANDAKPVVTESSSEQVHVDSGKPPVEENSAQKEQGKAQTIPYDRFKEVVDERNKLKALISDFEKQRGNHKANTSESNETEDKLMSKYSDKLEEQGLDPKAAKALAKTFKEMVDEETAGANKYVEEAKARDKETARLQKAATDMAEWRKTFSNAHPDYSEIEPLMQKEFEALDKDAQMAMVVSPKSFELLYNAAKAKKLPEMEDKARNDGRDEAYKTQALKNSLSNSPTSKVNPTKITPEFVAGLSTKEYKENRGEILKSLLNIKI